MGGAQPLQALSRPIDKMPFVYAHTHTHTLNSLSQGQQTSLSSPGRGKGGVVASLVSLSDSVSPRDSDNWETFGVCDTLLASVVKARLGFFLPRDAWRLFLAQMTSAVVDLHKASCAVITPQTLADTDSTLRECQTIHGYLIVLCLFLGIFFFPFSFFFGGGRP